MTFTPAGRRLVERLRPDVGSRLADAISRMKPSDARRLAELLKELLRSAVADEPTGRP